MIIHIVFKCHYVLLKLLKKKLIIILTDILLSSLPVVYTDNDSFLNIDPLINSINSCYNIQSILIRIVHFINIKCFTNNLYSL